MITRFGSSSQEIKSVTLPHPDPVISNPVCSSCPRFQQNIASLLETIHVSERHNHQLSQCLEELNTEKELMEKAFADTHRSNQIKLDDVIKQYEDKLRDREQELLKAKEDLLEHRVSAPSEQKKLHPKGSREAEVPGPNEDPAPLDPPKLVRQQGVSKLPLQVRHNGAKVTRDPKPGWK